MRIDLYTFCYNEMEILPFVIDYWKDLDANVTVFDNYSTDGSAEYLRKFDFINVVQYDTNNFLDDITLVNLKNSVWKKSKDNADYVIVCDMDECVYIKDKSILAEYAKQNITAITPKMCNMISLNMPKHNDDVLIHTLVRKYYDDIWNLPDLDIKGIKNKVLMFNPAKITDTNYKVGCYRSNFTGEVNHIISDDVYCIHLHDIGLYRKIRRYERLRNRMSDNNFKYHLSDFYLEDKNITIKDFMNDLNNSKELIT